MENKDKLEFLKEVKKNLEILTKETSTEENKNAQKFLTNLQKKNEDVNFILLLINSYEESLVFFGLKMFEELLDFKWENLSKMTQVSLKNFILQISNKPVYSDLNVTSSSFCDRKRNHCLIKIILKSSQTEIMLFLENLVEQSALCEFICEKNLSLIVMLFEEVLLPKNFKIKNSLLSDYQFLFLLKKIEYLCQQILEKTHFLIVKCPNLLQTCLNCLAFMIKISPPSYSFEEQLFILIIVLYPKNKTMNHSLNCLNELVTKEKETNTRLLMKIFMNFLIQFQELLPFTYNTGENYKIFSQENRRFILNTLEFINNVFKNRLETIFVENFFCVIFSVTNQFMVKFSCIPDMEIYKICLNWWLHTIDKDLILKENFLVRKIFKKVLFDLRIIIISRMAKPEEVLMTEDKNGQIIEEKVYDTEASEIYKPSLSL